MRQHDDMNWYVWEATIQELDAWAAEDTKNKVPVWLQTEMAEVSNSCRRTGLFYADIRMIACYLEACVDDLLEEWRKTTRVQPI